MGVALVVSEILEQATNLHRRGYLVGCLFLAVWVASFPLGAISFFLEKRKKTEEYMARPAPGGIVDFVGACASRNEDNDIVNVLTKKPDTFPGGLFAR